MLRAQGEIVSAKCIVVISISLCFCFVSGSTRVAIVVSDHHEGREDEIELWSLSASCLLPSCFYRQLLLHR
jgi:hypothetical protein